MLLNDLFVSWRFIQQEKAATTTPGKRLLLRLKSYPLPFSSLEKSPSTKPSLFPLSFPVQWPEIRRNPLVQSLLKNLGPEP